jgi:ferrous iron transport protein B
MAETKLRIALAGNPNCGKTTLFNALTGSNQFVGNWPGVTVEKKEGSIKKYDGVIVTDLPGIYSLSPYTLEEVVARNYLVGERPDAILNIVDGTNLERNLYLTTQLMELGIPVVIAINMMDVVRKMGDNINVEALSRKLGCKVVEISALKEDGIFEAAELAIDAAKKRKAEPAHIFSGAVEHAIAHIEEAAVHSLPDEQQRWYAIKIFERDERVIEQLKLDKEKLVHIEKDIVKVETDMDDDAESVIINERYEYIASVLKGCYKKKSIGRLTTSDKIDKVVTNRWLALPIFAAIMFLVYFISVTTVGTFVTDWTNDKLFGEGFHLFGIDGGYTEKAEEFESASSVVIGFIESIDSEELSEALDVESESFNEVSARALLNSAIALVPDDYEFKYTVVDEETLSEEEVTSTGTELKEAAGIYASYGFFAPDPSEYGIWVMGIPALVEMGLGTFECPAWLSGLILDGIVAGVGAVLGFVPQMLVLFIFLAFLEACGYMSRIAFVMDRVFRKLGLSGKSFIPMLIGTGCGVPGIMASRTIENVRDRRMTIITTTFIPCGAKLPFIAMIAGAVFGGAWWVAPSAYFIGMVAIVISGIMLKKTKLFTGDPATFVMELPAYHMPTVKNVLYSMWERGWSFIKKAGTVILLSSVIIWFTTYFGFVDGSFRMLAEEEVSHSILAYIGKGIAWIFVPLGFGTWQKAIASITGFIAKENIVATMGIVYGGIEGIADSFIYASGLSFLVFNILCAPCFAAIGAIRREMNSFKWTAFAITYQCVFAYAMALIAYQATLLITGAFTPTALNIIGLEAAVVIIVFITYMLVRPAKDKKGKRLNV